MASTPSGRPICASPTLSSLLSVVFMKLFQLCQCNQQRFYLALPVKIVECYLFPMHLSSTRPMVRLSDTVFLPTACVSSSSTLQVFPKDFRFLPASQSAREFAQIIAVRKNDPFARNKCQQLVLLPSGVELSHREARGIKNVHSEIYAPRENAVQFSSQAVSESESESFVAQVYIHQENCLVVHSKIKKKTESRLISINMAKKN